MMEVRHNHDARTHSQWNALSARTRYEAIRSQWNALGTDGQKQYEAKMKHELEQYYLLKKTYAPVKPPRVAFSLYYIDERNKFTQGDRQIPHLKLLEIWNSYRTCKNDQKSIEFIKYWQNTEREDYIRAILETIAFTKLMERTKTRQEEEKKIYNIRHDYICALKK